MTIVEMRYCTRCHINRDLVKVASTKTKNKTIQYYMCRLCNSARCMKYYYKRKKHEKA